MNLLVGAVDVTFVNLTGSSVIIPKARSETHQNYSALQVFLLILGLLTFHFI